MQKRQDGSYTLVETDGRTEVTYSITIDLSIPMLGMIKRKAEKVILDTALKELEEARRGLSRPVRTLLLTGPGGAGTSTLAAAAAVRAARSGRRTRAAVPAGGRRCRGWTRSPGLDVVRVDPQADARAALGRRGRRRRAPSCPQLTLPPASSVVPLPGTAELAALRRAGRAPRPTSSCWTPARSRRWPRSSALPAALRWWLDQLMPPGMRALGAVRTAAVAAGAAQARADRRRAGRRARRRGAAGPRPAGRPRRTRLPGRRAAARDAGRSLRAAVDRRWPCTAWPPAALSPACCRPTARAEWSAPPGGRAGRRPRRPRRGRTGAPGARARRRRPADVDELAGLLERLRRFPRRPAEAPAAERHEGGWQLTVPLPFAERADVDLTRWADDLVITVGGTRRSLRLDALLRRCEVTGGRLVDPGTSDARLVVGFRPDPAALARRPPRRCQGRTS